MSKLSTFLSLTFRNPRRLLAVIFEKVIAWSPDRKERFYCSVKSRIYYRYQYYYDGRSPDLRDPQLLSDKIQWRKYYCPSVNKFGRLADKLYSQQVAASLIDVSHLVPTLWYGCNFTASFLRSFGADVVIKTTHQSGQVVIITDPEIINYEKLSLVLHNALKWPYSMVGQEPWYGRVQPQIVVQPLLRSSEGSSYLDDAKFHVFSSKGGQKRIIGEIINLQGHWRAMFTESFDFIPCDISVGEYPRPEAVLERPSYWKHMIEDVKKLSSALNIDYVRIDFMMARDNYYFTEFTFAPNGGLLSTNPPEWNKELGDYWDFDRGNAGKRLFWFVRAWLPLWRTELPLRLFRRLYRYKNEWGHYIRPEDYLRD